MDLMLNEGQQLLSDSVQRLLADEYGFDKRQAIVASSRGYSETLWAKFAELGWLALPLPEAFGGLGGEFADVGLLAESFGGALVVEPFISTVILCGGAIAALGTDAQRDALLPRIAAGELIMAFAHAEKGDRLAPWRLRTEAKREGDRWRLNGEKTVVIAGSIADDLLVTASTGSSEQDVALFHLPADTPGLVVRPFLTIDGRRAANLLFEDVRLGADSLVGPTAGGRGAIETVVDKATVIATFQAIGAMRTIFDRTRDYLKVRVQFGRPLAANQALRHRVADMALRVEDARAIALRALLTLDTDADTRTIRLVTSAAKAKVGRCAQFVAAQAVQMHGGMGITEELDVATYFKSLLSFELEFGSADYHRGRHIALKALDDAGKPDGAQPSWT